MVDTIEYQLPPGSGSFNFLLQSELRRLFTFRHSILRADLEQHSRWSLKPRKTILISGASGFIGQALQAFLSTGGHSVLTLVRRKPETASERFWDPNTGALDPHCFNGVDIVINLCGENVAAGRWTRKRKLRIEESRVSATTLLAKTIASLATPPELLICASGTGFYGHRSYRSR
jgi:nucleoside-diphosphate-sugar epimerase